jgi:hypothetical protein
MPLASMPLASAAERPQLVRSPPLGAPLPSQGNLQFRDLFMYQYCLLILPYMVTIDPRGIAPHGSITMMAAAAAKSPISHGEKP